MFRYLMLKKVCNVTCWREISAGCSGNKSVPGGGCLKERWALEEGFAWALNKNGEGTCSWWLSPLARRYPRRKGSLKVPRMASEIRFADQCALGHTATSTNSANLHEPEGAREIGLMKGLFLWSAGQRFCLIALSVQHLRNWGHSRQCCHFTAKGWRKREKKSRTRNDSQKNSILEWRRFAVNGMVSSLTLSLNQLKNWRCRWRRNVFMPEWNFLSASLRVRTSPILISSNPSN